MRDSPSFSSSSIDASGFALFFKVAVQRAGKIRRGAVNFSYLIADAALVNVGTADVAALSANLRTAYTESGMHFRLDSPPLLAAGTNHP
jgi:hypothetical protein